MVTLFWNLHFFTINFYVCIITKYTTPFLIRFYSCWLYILYILKMLLKFFGTVLYGTQCGSFQEFKQRRQWDISADNGIATKTYVLISVFKVHMMKGKESSNSWTFSSDLYVYFPILWWLGELCVSRSDFFWVLSLWCLADWLLVWFVSSLHTYNYAVSSCDKGTSYIELEAALDVQH